MIFCQIRLTETWRTSLLQMHGRDRRVRCVELFKILGVTSILCIYDPTKGMMSLLMQASNDDILSLLIGELRKWLRESVSHPKQNRMGQDLSKHLDCVKQLAIAILLKRFLDSACLDLLHELLVYSLLQSGGNRCSSTQTLIQTNIASRSVQGGSAKLVPSVAQQKTPDIDSSISLALIFCAQYLQLRLACASVQGF